MQKAHLWLRDITPGTALCAGLSLLAWLCAGAEHHLLGQAYLEPLVLAIVIGVAVGTVWQPGRVWERGIAFSGRTLLECAVMLLGLSISTRALMQQGDQVFGRGVMKRILFISLALLSVGVSAKPAPPQGTGSSGTITGTINDPTGATIAGATVEIRNQVTGFDCARIFVRRMRNSWPSKKLLIRIRSSFPWARMSSGSPMMPETPYDGMPI